ncbi:MAG: hypothetical protein A2Y80_04345, partial [Deltaproteobacteria bacterium RBG_13_58_19]
PGRDSGQSSPDGRQPAFPKAAVLVPLTGTASGMRLCLESLLTQDYPDYETVFITRDLEDPATFLIRDLLTHHRQARHIISGPAQSCSQKNHNLLAGIGVLDNSVQVLVFCDSTHLAPKNFLQELIRPLAQGEAVLTTGFHHILAGDFRLATLGMLLTVMTIHLLLAVKRLAHPWGGATAILRQVFEDYQVARVWAETVVDDFTMGPHLLRAGIMVKAVPGACLTTPMAGQTMRGWVAWLTRQLMYLKYCLPGTWVAAALGMYLLAGPILLAGLAALGGAVGLVSPGLALMGLLFLLILTGVGVLARSLTPRAIPWLPWIAAFYAALLVAPWCYLKTWATDIIAWRGTSYRVTWGGKVTEIITNP